MQIMPINNMQNFKGLNTSRVCSMDLKKIKNELPALEKLGEKYHIKLQSSYVGVYDMESIDITVSPLRKNFFAKLFVPKQRATFLLNKDKSSIVDKVNETIQKLHKENKLENIVDTFEH